jgi:hypothetical protein
MTRMDDLEARLAQLEQVGQSRTLHVLAALVRQAERVFEHGSVEATIQRHLELWQAIGDAKALLAEHGEAG